ncbi:type II secretion system F family protein [Galenea microaerophila]
MEKYVYTGINQFGRRIQGEMPAANPRDLEQRLLSNKIELITYKLQKKGFKLTRTSIKTQDLITLTSELRMLLEAGVPLMSVIDDERQNYPNDAVREMMASVYESMEGGESFSQALEPYRALFGDVYLSLVSVGEKTGQLDKVLADLESMMTWQQALISKAKKIMIYPSIVGVVIILVIILMMVFVVPQIISFVKEMQGELGFATKSLIATSNFVQHHIVEILLTPILLFFGVKWAKQKIPSFSRWLDEHLLKIKLIGPIIYKLKLARMANTLATMSRAGVGFLDSLELSKKVVNNDFMENQITVSRQLIADGRHIYEAFTVTELMPAMALRIIKAGEESGKMDQALENISRIYDKQAKDLIEKIEPAIEPALTVIMAVLVGWVMIAVLGPVYDTISKVQ